MGVFQARKPHLQNQEDGKWYAVLDTWGVVQLGKYWQVGEGRKAARVDQKVIIRRFNVQSQGFRIKLQTIGSHQLFIFLQYYIACLWKNAQRNAHINVATPRSRSRTWPAPRSPTRPFLVTSSLRVTTILIPFLIFFLFLIILT